MLHLTRQDQSYLGTFNIVLNAGLAYYNNVPSANSLVAWKIREAWIVQIHDVGHALFMQYPGSQ